MVPCLAEPISTSAFLIGAGIKAGASLISGLIGAYGSHKAGQQSAAAQREANMLNYGIYMKQLGEDTRRFNIQTALEKLKFRLWKETEDFNKEELIDNKNYSRTMDFTNRLAGMSNTGMLRGQNLSNVWAGQSALARGTR